MQVNARELAWAAGLFEGEGCVGLYTPKPRAGDRPRGAAQLRLFMATTDLDTLERFHKAIGGLGNRCGTQQQKAHYKVCYRWNCYKFEHCQAIIAMLWFGLGERRRARCAEVLTAYMEARR